MHHVHDKEDIFQAHEKNGFAEISKILKISKISKNFAKYRSENNFGH